jgi:hypothetical protein
MEKLVDVGNGMAGVGCVEQILKYGNKFEITIFGDETHLNYNRILLSSVLAAGRLRFSISEPTFWRLIIAARARADLSPKESFLERRWYVRFMRGRLT